MNSKPKPDARQGEAPAQPAAGKPEDGGRKGADESRRVESALLQADEEAAERQSPRGRTEAGNDPGRSGTN